MKDSGPPYRPMFESVSVLLKNGNAINIFEIDRQVVQKIEETENILGREDRIIWALRFFKKALIEELLWKVKNKPEFFQKRFRSPPAPEQPNLMRQFQKLADVDITPFREYDPNDPEMLEPPYSGFGTIDAIKERINSYLQFAEKMCRHSARKSGR